MAEQVKATPQRQRESEPEAEESQPVNLANEELGADVEDILAEIDGVLEENAEEFVRQYVQKGGQ